MFMRHRQLLKSLQYLEKILITAILLSVIVVSQLNAEYYLHNDSNPTDADYSGVLGNFINLGFNSETKILDIKINTYPFNVIQNYAEQYNFFQIVINNGSASGGAGEQAIIAIDVFDINNPKITAYAFNGASGDCFLFPASYYFGQLPSSPPDQIKSFNASNWVISYSGSSDLTSQTFEISLNVADLINHIPLYGTAASWLGTGFNSNISVEMYGINVNHPTDYDSNGYIDHFYFSENECIHYRLDNASAAHTPACVIEGALLNQTCLGEETPISLTAQKSSTLASPIAYDWSVSCNGDASLTNTNAQETSVIFKDPYLGKATECAVSLTVTDQLSTASCKETISVAACPVCTDTNVSSALGFLDGSALVLSQLSGVAASEYVRVSGQRKISPDIRTILTNSKQLRIQAWETINRIPTNISSCSTSTNCFSVDLQNYIDSYMSYSRNLLSNLEKITDKIRRLAKSSNQHGSFRHRWRRIRNQGRRTLNSIESEAGSLPSTNTLCI